MSQRLPSHFIDLVRDALLKSFWRKPSLRQFLQRHHVTESFLATWAPDETKRELLDRLFPKLESTDKGRQVIKQMAISLADQIAFPDLKGWEDETLKIKAATEAVAALKSYLKKAKEEESSHKEREAIREAALRQREETRKHAQNLQTLQTRLFELLPAQGTQQGGYDFQTWFYDLVDFYEVACKRPYVSSSRQIDGTVTVEGTTYLVELKFTQSQSGATDIDSLLAKLTNVADNTMGIFVSMPGYSSVAIDQASGKKTPLLLMDHAHVMALLQGTWKLDELISRLRRHVSQTGEAYLTMSRVA
jgi:hypothetical protein